MERTAEQVEQEIKAVYPNWKYLWLKDNEWWLPHPDEVKEQLARVSASKMWEVLLRMREQGMIIDVGGKRITYKPDCDDLVLQKYSAIRLIRPMWPIGECTGTLYEGPSERVHDRIICVTSEGVKIVEAEDDTIHEPDITDYDPFFGRI